MRNHDILRHHSQHLIQRSRVKVSEPKTAKNVIFTFLFDVFIGFWLRDLDLWHLGQMLRMWTQDIVIAHRLVGFASKSDSRWRNERVPIVKNDVFSGFWLRDLDLWHLGQILRTVTQDIVIAHRVVAFASKSDSKWRNERVPTVKNDVFNGFWLRDLDLWPLGQMLRMVTEDVVISHLLVAFASKSDSKWSNERVPRYSTLQTNTNTTLTWRTYEIFGIRGNFWNFAFRKRENPALWMNDYVKISF